MDNYQPKKIEPKWQEKWSKTGLYQDYSKKKKFYALDMFPYPSGAGLHVGHPKGYIATDIVARFKMLEGYSVLHPMGWDAFGLPAENYAIKNKIHPEIAVEKNIATFKSQLLKFGFTYDWNREINTTDPEYYKWTQWIFLQMFKKGLAYESAEPVNWCPKCKTVLANEDLEKGRCERCGSQVIQRKIRQWVLRITDYADRLLYDLDKENLDWEELIKEQQRNWIGRSEGAIIKFKIKSEKIKVKEEFFIETYTTRLDTIYGCTYCVVAPEHPIISKLKNQISNFSEVKKYIIQAQNKTELERTELQKEKTGVVLKGIKAINPFNQAVIPVFVADYVLGFYGTGAVMAVPAHDERDFEFAKKYNLPIKKVIEPLFITTTGPDKFRADETFAERNAIAAIVKHWEKDSYIVLKWKKANWQTFITGGPEKGQTMEEGARMEIIEETGYKNMKMVKELPRFHSKFYHIPKKLNRFVHMRPFYFELTNNEHKEISEAEKENHEVMWIRKENVEKAITPDAQKYIWDVLIKPKKAFCEDGILNDSGDFSNLTSAEAREKMTQWLEKEKIGHKKVNYKMRDWVFSRQRYWGEPIPLIFCPACKKIVENSKIQIPISKKIQNSKFKIQNSYFNVGEILNPGWVADDELPLKLPEVESYQPTDSGESPLANIVEWVNTKCPKCGRPAKRETNTMPQWAGSCWYYLAYIMKENSKFEIRNSKLYKEWLPVSLYVGGAEHATRHLLYARFWHKFLYDIGVVSTKEPFKRYINVGLINAADGRKMSKRWNNVINPDDMIAEYGADALRLYEMFMGPFTQNIAWSTKGVSGTQRFLEKIWKLQNKISEKKASGDKINNLLHKAIKKVGEDIENFRFNTAVSQMMILVNEMEEVENISKENFKTLLIILSPFAPHITEELWSQLGNKKSIFKEKWPKYDPKLIKDEEFQLVIQINGKVRDTVAAAMEISENEAKKLAQQSEKVINYLTGKEIKKIIFVKNRLINIVI